MQKHLKLFFLNVSTFKHMVQTCLDFFATTFGNMVEKQKKHYFWKRRIQNLRTIQGQLLCCKLNWQQQSSAHAEHSSGGVSSIRDQSYSKSHRCDTSQFLSFGALQTIVHKIIFRPFQRFYGAVSSKLRCDPKQNYRCYFAQFAEMTISPPTQPLCVGGDMVIFN